MCLAIVTLQLHRQYIHVSSLSFNSFCFFSRLLPTQSSVIAANGASQTVAAFEAPIEDQLVHSEIIPVYSAMATFEPTALDTFGRQKESNERRRCADAPELAKHRALTLAYVTYWAFGAFVPFALETFDPLYTGWNVKLDICDDPNFDCTDLATPWGLARTLVDEAIFMTDNDGWNWKGDLSSKYNKVPYKDWRSNPYKPAGASCNTDSCWEPLEEHDGLGFLYNQVCLTV